MAHKTNTSLITGLLMASLVIALNPRPAPAGGGGRHNKVAVVIHPGHHQSRHYPYHSPYFVYSVPSILRYLSGGTKYCWLPTEPCDNAHRVQN